MPDLPTGTVTFLFTDIEGSTKHWETAPEAMSAALARHDALLSEAFRACGGHIFKTIGDAFQVAFANPIDAILGATDAQRALASEDWSACGDDFPALRVRMALHIGPAVPAADGDYRTPLLNRVARLMSAGHGGQVLLSTALWELVQSSLPEGVSLRDLGERRLKDLRRPERVFQVLAPDLPADFPPLATLDARPNNLPVQLTAFVGRETVLMELTRLFQTSDGPRLVTLTGTGGTGKTRLALQTAAALIDDFAHGVWFVDLASLVDSELVPATIAAALELKPIPDEPILDTLKAWLAGKQLLLVLDNFEQLLDGAPVVTELLARSPRLKVLATSRAALRLRGERDFPVDPLAAPSVNTKERVEAIARYPAVELFVQRAVDVVRGFALTPANAMAVGRICGRLEGLPLAIELAAARVPQFEPEALLERLESRLKVLTDGFRDLPTRQQTMRATIAWSYDLLAHAEQRLFRTLAVFAGGWTLAAAESVCQAGDSVEMDVLDGLGTIVGKSLVRVAEGPAGEPRYAMFETIREFGVEQLAEAGEEAAARQRHARRYVEWTHWAWESCADITMIPDFVVHHLVPETDNLRAGLGWCRQHDVSAGLRLVGALNDYWIMSPTHRAEGREWVRDFLDRSADCPADARAAGYLAAGTIAFNEGRYLEAEASHRTALALYSEAGNRGGSAVTHVFLASQRLNRGDYADAQFHLESGQAMAREAANPRAILDANHFLQQVAGAQGRFEEARSYVEEGLALRRAIAPWPDIDQEWWFLNNLAAWAYLSGDLDTAADYGERALERWQEPGIRPTGMLATVGRIRLARGDLRGAEAIFREGVEAAVESEQHLFAAPHIEGLAVLARQRGAPLRAAELRGAAAAMRERGGIAVEPAERLRFEAEIALLRADLGKEAFEAAWSRGQARTLDEVVEEAMTIDMS